MKLPKALQTRIIERFYSGKALADFLEQYNDAKLRRTREREVTKTDLNILRDYKESKLMPNELMRKYKVSRNQLNTALRIAALSKI